MSKAPRNHVSPSKNDRLALSGGSPVGGVSFPPFPSFSARALRRVVEVLESGQTFGLNRSYPTIREAEVAISAYHGGLHCLGTSSGHGALQMALAGLEIGPGDEVITTPYTWGASISCILHQGAVPVFADVNPVTGLLEPAAIEARITERSRAILVVHLYGQPADMPAILKIAKKHGLKVIEDGSQAHGARIHGKVVGNFGDAAGFSCMGGKLLATTEAGYLVTASEDVYWKACLLSQHMGRSSDPGFPEELRPYVDSLVYTYRLNPVNAVLLTEQLKKLDKENAARTANLETLRTLLADAPYLRFPEYPRGFEPVYHLVTMNFDSEAAGVARDTYLRALQAEGWPVVAYVPAPITHWRRLDWRRYDGPRVLWMEALKRHRVNYATMEVPGCEYKVAHAVEAPFNFVRPAKAMMKRIAEIVDKVDANLDALRQWEQAHQP